MVTKTEVKKFYANQYESEFVPEAVIIVLADLDEDKNGVYSRVNEFFFDSPREYLALSEVVKMVQARVAAQIKDLTKIYNIQAE